MKYSVIYDNEKKIKLTKTEEDRCEPHPKNVAVKINGTLVLLRSGIPIVVVRAEALL